jgi:HSP20 family protein
MPLETKVPAPSQTRDPFHALRSEIDRVFEGFGRALPTMTWPSEVFSPKIDMAESDHNLRVTAELPGVDPEQVELSVDGDMLTIRGEKTEETREETDEKRLYERSYGAFARSVRLPFAPDPAAIEARFDKGVLTLSIPTPPEKRPSARKIPIKTG